MAEVRAEMEVASHFDPLMLEGTGCAFRVFEGKARVLAYELQEAGEWGSPLAVGPIAKCGDFGCPIYSEGGVIVHLEYRGEELFVMAGVNWASRVYREDAAAAPDAEIAATRKLQRILVRHCSRLPPSFVDGRDGPATRAALRRFQSAYGLVPDGVIGPETSAALQGPVTGDCR